MKLIDLSERIDSSVVVIYSTIAQVINELHVDFLVVGATARDLILDSVYNMPPLRRTMDIDIGVRMRSWEHFESLKNNLIQTGKFTSTRDIQRIQYIDGPVTYPVDIVPFGKISEPNQIIDWQTGNDIQMNVLGFEQAFQNSITIILRHEPLLEIKIASLPSQLALKILAWSDRRADKDAHDIYTLIKSYGYPVSQDRLYDEELEVMVLEEYDIDHAGAHLIGKDINKTATLNLKTRLTEILDQELSEENNFKLILAMPNTLTASDFEAKLSLLQRVRQGLG